MTLPKIGNLAPSFKAKNQDGEVINLKDFRGKTVVLYFYPKAMTPGCTLQAGGVRDHKKDFKKLDVVVLGISPDAPEKLKRFEERDGLNFNLLSDEGHKIADKYGAWGPKKFMGKEYDGILRQTYIINPKGKLVDILTKFKTKTHHETVLDYIKENLI